MPNRIDIELTSSQPDGTWTWRAADAKQPRGVLDGGLLPAGAAVGDQIKVETEQGIDGINVLSVVPAKTKEERRDLLELLPSDRPFEPVVEHRARRDRGDRPGGDRRGPRRDGPGGDRRGPRRDGPGGERRGPGRDGPGGDRRGPGRDGPGGDRRGPGRDGPGGDRRGPRRNFTPPPEIEQRPKPKRLRAGNQHRNEVLAGLPDEQRPIAELATQGMPAVRQRLSEYNARLRNEGKPEMPEPAVMKMAEEVLPKLRVAEWLDRAEAAKSQLADLDLRDLRSVVAAADDPVVARDTSTSELAASLKVDLANKLEQETQLWLGDIEAAVGVGRIIRALRLSSQPPKAGVPFPPGLANQLGDAATEALQPADPAERWVAVLEAVAFSPVRSQVLPARKPSQVTDELTATVKRLGPLLPHIAELFGIEVPEGAPAPRPLRTPPRKQAEKRGAKPPRDGREPREPREGRGPRPDRAPRDQSAADAGSQDRADQKPAASTADDTASPDVTAAADTTATDTTATESTAAETTATDTTAVETAATEAPVADEAPSTEDGTAPPADDAPAAEAPADDAPAPDTAAESAAADSGDDA